MWFRAIPSITFPLYKIAILFPAVIESDMFWVGRAHSRAHQKTYKNRWVPMWDTSIYYLSLSQKMHMTSIKYFSSYIKNLVSKAKRFEICATICQLLALLKKKPSVYRCSRFILSQINPSAQSSPPLNRLRLCDLYQVWLLRVWEAASLNIISWIKSGLEEIPFSSINKENKWNK